MNCFGICPSRSGFSSDSQGLLEKPLPLENARLEAQKLAVARSRLDRLPDPVQGVIQLLRLGMAVGKPNDIFGSVAGRQRQLQIEFNPFGRSFRHFSSVSVEPRQHFICDGLDHSARPCRIEPCLLSYHRKNRGNGIEGFVRDFHDAVSRKDSRISEQIEHGLPRRAARLELRHSAGPAERHEILLYNVIVGAIIIIVEQDRCPWFRED